MHGWRCRHLILFNGQAIRARYRFGKHDARLFLLMSARTTITQAVVKNQHTFYLGAIYEDARKWYAGRRKVEILFRSHVDP